MVIAFFAIIKLQMDKILLITKFKVSLREKINVGKRSMLTILQGNNFCAGGVVDGTGSAPGSILWR